MKLSEFDYNLPEELIAQSPMEPRDHSRLLVLDKKSGEISYHTFYEVVDYLKSGDILVVNNSKVFPARLFGYRKDSGGKVEILLNKNIIEASSFLIPASPGVIPATYSFPQILPSVIPTLHSVIPASHSVIPAKAGIQDSNFSIWEAMGKNLKTDTKIIFENSKLEAIVLEKKEKIAKIKFNLSGKEFFSEIEKIGHTPLPPYIKKYDTKKDKIDYQTVYASPIGSAAAPTAGLHFTKELLSQMQAKGVEIAKVTLHVGLGTFAPVETDDIENHKIHSEYYTVIPSEIKKVILAKKEGRRIIAVGTTSTRVLETIFSCGCHPERSEGSIKKEILRSTQNDIKKCDDPKNFKPTTDLLLAPRSLFVQRSLGEVGGEVGTTKNYSGWTEIFIYPGYKFKCVDGLITNFHLPKSSLLMLVSAFAGKENIDKAYQEAIARKYRFFSYGDAMLII